MTVENRRHDAILTAMDKVVIPRFEMAVRSITGSSGHRPNSVDQNPGRRDFTGNTENIPLMSTSSQLDLNIDQDRIDETRDIDNFRDGDFAALEPNYDQRAQTHHTFTFLTKLKNAFSISENVNAAFYLAVASKGSPFKSQFNQAFSAFLYI